jgi:hypothetical protein
MGEGLSELWRLQQQATFPPSFVGKAVDGVALTKVDADVGRILTDVLRKDAVPRPLEAGASERLARGRALLARALAAVDLDEEGRTYFSRLMKLADEILVRARFRGIKLIPD